MTSKEELINAEGARQILENEVFKKAVADIEEGLLYSLRQSPVTDEKLREKICQYYTLLHKLLDSLKSTMENGVFARKSLELEEQQRSWLKRFKSAA